MLMVKALLQKKFLSVVISFGVAVVVVSAVISYFLFQSKNDHVTTVDDNDISGVEFIEPSPPNLKDQPMTLTIALLGTGGPGHQGGHLSDVIQLLHINFDQKQIGFISIPRDLWVPLPDGSTNKINAVYAAGLNQKTPVPHQALKSSLSAISGLQVDYVIAIDFTGFKRAIGENLKGIEVEVAEALDDPWYPISGKELEPCGYTPQEIDEMTQTLSGFELEKQFECRYEHISFKPGNITMHGGDALAFVRSRHSSSDFARSARQHAILQGVRKKIISIDGLSKLPALFTDLAKQTTTDLNVDIITFLVPSLKMAADFKTTSVVLSTENVLQSGKSSTGQFILLPKAGQNNWGDAQSFISTSLEEDQS